MSPSERAADLIAKFSPHVEIHKWDGKNESHKDEYHYSPIKSVANAKACAIICCDLLIEVTGNADDLVNKLIGIMSESDKKYFEKANESKAQIYWHSVKTEIQKL